MYRTPIYVQSETLSDDWFCPLRELDNYVQVLAKVQWAGARGGEGNTRRNLQMQHTTDFKENPDNEDGNREIFANDALEKQALMAHIRTDGFLSIRNDSEAEGGLHIQKKTSPWSW